MNITLEELEKLDLGNRSYVEVTEREKLQAVAAIPWLISEVRSRGSVIELLESGAKTRDAKIKALEAELKQARNQISRLNCQSNTGAPSPTEESQP